VIQTRVQTTNPIIGLPATSAVILAPRADVSALASHPTAQKAVQLGTIEPPLHALFKYWSKPTACALALLLSMLAHGQRLNACYAALGVCAVLLSRHVFTPTRLRPSCAPQRPQWRIVRLVGEWALVAALLVFMGAAFGLGRLFPHEVLWGWLGATLAILLVSDLLSARVAARIAVPHKHIIIGANEVGMELARRGAEHGDSSNFLGFFDFRNPDRLPAQARDRFLGACKDVAAFVQRHAVNAIYIAIPMSNAARIVDLVQEFRDTTASIYFVPDMFAFDLVQPRCVEFNGIPLLSVCDTPFHGMDAVYKRAMDLLLVSLVLLFAWPVMVAVAVAVKLSSPGPVLFKQRRYGLHGEQILVYKFRSMTVCEDGPTIRQAERSDRRVTTVGRFLRRTSLDELPQLFNVLEGKMSFVGPRPHAVVHNELYRKLISGYMIRHKVRPGMTGWAQVHGLRGETSTVEQMRLRAQYDLDYLRHWSIWLDAKILLRTALIVIHGHNAH
jgi:putative colanic acid biosynthesis UDP-glucose lipid carrier transferase